MKSTALRWLKPEYGMGLALLLLRSLENRAGFDPATALALATPLRAGLIALTVAFFLLECGLQRRSSPCPLPFSQMFAPPAAELPLLVAGCMLLAGGGALLLLQGAAAPLSVVNLVSGAMAAAAAGGLLLLLRGMRAGSEVSVAMLLPAMFFGVFFLLAIYLPFSSDPILARYWLPVLAAAICALSFAQLAGFFRAESGSRRFRIFANTAVILSLAVLGDPLALPLRLLFAGCAVVLSGFAMLISSEDETTAANKTNGTNET